MAQHELRQNATLPFEAEKSVESTLLRQGGSGKELARAAVKMALFFPRAGLRPLVLSIAGSTIIACSSAGPPSPESGGPAGATAADGGTVTGAAPSDDVGAVTLHRLNAVEYDNTVRDLLGDTSHPSSAFPRDDGAYGFDNIADALTISPMLFEQYDISADKLAAVAIHDPRIMTCDPAQSGVDACSQQILGGFLRRAWRRRISADEIATIRQIGSVTALSFEEGIQIAIKAALLSPNFLFRVESDPVDAGGKPHALNDYELASRLSYFLWSSMPDDALLAFADAGKLSDDGVLGRQIRRMLADPKAQALVDNFASQWLLHTFDESVPDPMLFPSFDADLRASMRAETKAFVGSFLFGDQRLPDMLDAPFTFVDARMAGFYGIPASSGTDPVRVNLDPATHRGGLLTQASILTMTSISTRTSVVRRGEWVLSQLLCAPPPPPPPNVPALPTQITTGTMRERLEEHRKDPACSGCHSQMDPIGFALEHYDALGRWRDTDRGLPIDATGTLPTGQTFDGEPGLGETIKSDPRFVDCATRKLFSYALGRVPGTADEQRIKGLVEAFGKSDYRMEELIVNVIASDAFRNRQGGS